MSILLGLLAASCAIVASVPTDLGIVADQDSRAIPPAVLDDTLEVTGDPIDARQVRTRMTVGATVNGRGPFRFLVDSGADRSVIGAALAKRLALPSGRTVTLHGMAGTSCVETVRLDRLRVGSSESRDLTLPALAEADLGADGLLGIDALAGQRLTLDFDAEAITIQDARRPFPVFDADEIVVTARRRKGQLILTEAAIGGRQVYAVIDSGAEVTIGNASLRAAVFRRRKPPEIGKMTLTSVTGQTIVADTVVLPELRIGGLTLLNVPIAFAEAPPFAFFDLTNRPAVFLGTDVLRIFRRVSLDFRNRKIRFLTRR